MHSHPPRTGCTTFSSETAKLFFIECVGARPSENTGAELGENALGFRVHAELLHTGKRNRAKAISV